jgi:hypothetical protein
LNDGLNLSCGRCRHISAFSKRDAIKAKAALLNLSILSRTNLPHAASGAIGLERVKNYVSERAIILECREPD